MSERKLYRLHDLVPDLVNYQVEHGGASVDQVSQAVRKVTAELTQWVTQGAAITGGGKILDKRILSDPREVTVLTQNKINRDLEEQKVIGGNPTYFRTKYGMKLVELYPVIEKNGYLYIVGSQVLKGLRYWLPHYGKGVPTPTFEYLNGHKSGALAIGLNSLVKNICKGYISRVFDEHGVITAGPSSMINAGPLANAIYMQLADYDAFGSVSTEAVGAGEIAPFDKRN